MAGRFPRAPYNTVPEEGTAPNMEYTKLQDMDYGARKSAMPKDMRKPGSIEHVGGSTGGKGK